MPVEKLGNAHNLVRRVKRVRGEIRFRMGCAPRFDYGACGAPLRTTGRRAVVFTSEGPEGWSLRLRSSVPLEIENGDAVARFTLRADESASFVLEDARERAAVRCGRVCRPKVLRAR